MFSRPHVLVALEAKRHSFEAFERSAGEALDRYERNLDGLTQRSRQEIEQFLREAGIVRPGALPTTEREAGQSVVRPFAQQFIHHQDAREWARATLEGVPTLAVDGSQITPNQDFSIPVGAVQIGEFENHHELEGSYRKEIRFEVLGPEDLAEEQADEGIFPDRQVNLRRFELECAALSDYMRAKAGQQPTPVCFFDGSLIISFAARMSPALQTAYVRAVQDMLSTSEQTRVPLVGYVDTSRARDLVSLLQILSRDTQPPDLSDGTLLRRQMRWGERTEAFCCARDDGLFAGTAGSATLGDAADYYNRVVFVYLKTTANHTPARLDLPAWVLEANRLEGVVDIVRAECVVGTGYPYAVETADALAVITARDAERFYRTLQEYVEGLGLQLRYSRKAYSKRGRRT